MNEQTIFSAALERPVDERQAFLDDACAGDAAMRRRILKLLAAFEDDPCFMDQPAGVLADSKPDALIGAQIGRYRLSQQIGEGGMGIVYVAEQKEPVQRIVALKVIKPGMASKEVISRFESERQALSMMNHPNIARVFDGGVTDAGQPYFVMELVQGAPVNSYCDDHQLTTGERLRLFTTICKAVQHAHQKGIIHRDLKPSNIIVAEIDHVAVPKVIDFGVAKAINQSLTKETLHTHFTQVAGTPLYMSPEQAGLGVIDVDTRSDVYSLGVLLYELLAGRTPFDMDTFRQAGFDEMRRMIREDDPPLPSDRVSTLNDEALSTLAERRASKVSHLSNRLRGELDWIVMKALEKDRSRRYESASDLADDVDRHLCDEPISARPATRWYRAQKFVRRNRTLVASSAAVLISLAAGLALSTTALLHAVDQRGLAQHAQEIAQQRATQLAATLKEKESALQEVKKEQEDNRVLISLFSDMYPKHFLLVNPGKSRTVYESIEEMAADIDNGRLQSHPRVEIQVRRILADAYFAAREFDKFRQHLEKALVLAAREFGDRHLDVARIHERLAYEISHNIYGPKDPESVLRHAERAIEIFQIHNIESVHAWVGKTYALLNLERLDQAVEAAYRAIELDGEYPDFSYVDLGNVLMQYGDGEHLLQALDCFEQAINNYAKRGNPHANIRASLLAHKAKCLRQLGDLKAAGAAYREAYDLHQTPERRVEPEGHSYGLALANILFAIGEVDQAFARIDEIQQVSHEHDLNASLIRCLDLRGWLYLQLGDLEAAERNLRKAKQRAEQSVGKMNLLYAFPCLHLAMCYQAWERTDAARPYQDLAARQYHDLLPLTTRFIETPQVSLLANWIHAHGLLATSGTDPRQYDRAEDIANQALDKVRTRQQPYFEPAFHVLLAMIQYSRHSDQLNSAIAELKKGWDRAEEPFATFQNSRIDQVPTDRWQVEAKLVDFLLAAQQSRAAQQILEQAVTVRRDVPSLGPDHIQTALAEIRLGRFLLDQENLDSAALHLRNAYESKALSEFSSLDGLRRNVAGLLVAVHQQRGDAAAAARWRKTLAELPEDANVKAASRFED